MQLVRALQCDAPSDADVLGSMGAVLLDGGGDAAEARRWLEAARERAPDSPRIRYQLARAAARSGDRAGARGELEEALRSGVSFDEEPDARRLLRELAGGEDRRQR
jgi:predicted Zn-dependent protease